MEEKPCYSCGQDVIEKSPPCPLQCMSTRCKAYQRQPPIDSTKTPIVWVLGGPGSGVGHQSVQIATKYGFFRLCTSDLLRNEAKSTSDRAQCLTTIMARHDIVPHDVVVDLLKKAIIEKALEAKGFVIDDFPQEKSQGVAFEKLIAPATVILYFEESSESLSKKLAGRADEETIKQRLKTFFENKDEVLTQYTKKIRRINTEGTPDSIFNQVMKILDPLVTTKLVL